MTEIETILGIRKLFPVSSQQKNTVLACDAELFLLGDSLYGISMDDFSYAEDYFNDTDLTLLGHNLAVATISDILAAGCAPQMFLHSIVEPHMHRGEGGFALGISHGVRAVLEECGCSLLGGDMGSNSVWRYTGVVMGQCLSPQGLTRIVPPRKQTLWMTGTVGDGNLCAFNPEASTRFELRLEESRAMQGVATACIDTSGGFMESLALLAQVNPGHSFHARAGLLPFDPQVLAAAQAHGLPVEGFAFGGAGEYELLFTTDEGVLVDYATPVGTVVPSASPGVFWNNKPLPCALPDARMYPHKDDYIREVLKMVQLCQ